MNIWQILISIGWPILKWLVGRAEKKDISDKEFLRYIRAMQLQRAKAGDAALSFDDALEEAKAEMENE